MRRQPWYEREWNNCAASLASPAIVEVGLVSSTLDASLTPVDVDATVAAAAAAASPPPTDDAAAAAIAGGASISPSATLLFTAQRTHALGLCLLSFALFLRLFSSGLRLTPFVLLPSGLEKTTSKFSIHIFHPHVRATSIIVHKNPIFIYLYVQHPPHPRIPVSHPFARTKSVLLHKQTRYSIHPARATCILAVFFIHLHVQRPSSSTHTSIFIHLQHLSSSTIFWSWNMRLWNVMYG